MALTGNVARETHSHLRVTLPVKANAVLYYGAAAVIDGGFLAPARTATGLVTAGVVDQDNNRPVDNTGGADGAISCSVRKDIFGFRNSEDDDEITNEDHGKLCYWVDDETVALTSATNTRSVAGRILCVKRGWVFVDLR